MSVLKTKFAARAAKTLRVNSTPAERKLWSRLRDRRLLGYKFVRQQPVGRYIADFACREADLVVELGSSQHGEGEAVACDHERTNALGQHGYGVIRFWNSDVLRDLDGVLLAIIAQLEKAPSPGRRFATSDLSPKGEVTEPTTHSEVAS